MTLASAIAQGHHAYYGHSAAQMIRGANCKRYLFKRKEKTLCAGPAGPEPSMIIRPPVYRTSQKAIEFIRAKNEAEKKKKKKKKTIHKNFKAEA